MNGMSVAALVLLLALAQPFMAAAQEAASLSRGRGGDDGRGGGDNSDRGGGRGDDRNDDRNGGSGKGDPLMQAFDGSLFFFHGEPGKIYNLASVPASFQVSSLLKEANNAVHIGSAKNGTYMQAVAFQQNGVKIVMETYADDSSRMTVKLNDEPQNLDVAGFVRSIPIGAKAAIDVTFKAHETEKGTLLTIRSPTVKLGVYLVPPGLDAAGFWQPSYLNFDLTLLAAPVGTLQGVIGDTFHYEGTSMSAKTADDPTKMLKAPAFSDLVYPVFPDSTYELPSLFDAQSMTFPAAFIHETILMRKAATAKLLPAGSGTTIS